VANPYPFQGIWRWAVLPSFLSLAGALGGIFGGCVAGETMKLDIGYWVIQGFVKAAVEGGALAFGKRPVVALIAVLVLGALSVWSEQGLMDAVYGAGFVDVRIGTILGFGVVSALMVATHHLYLRARRRGPRTAVAAGLVYPVAATVGMAIYVYVIIPFGQFRLDLLFWAVAEGLLAWAALAVAARLAERTSERAAPAPTPPAPNA